MNFSKNRKIIRFILISFSFIIVTAILWNTYNFIQKFKEEERTKMEIIAEAQVSLVKLVNNNDDFKIFKKTVLNLPNLTYKTKQEILKIAKEDFENLSLNSGYDNLFIKILNSNKTIPIISTDEKGKIIRAANLDKKKENDSLYIKEQLAIMKKNNDPIKLSWVIDGKKYTRYQYYKDSDLLTKLKYYPLALLLILTLFASVIFLVIKSTQVAEQNKLWAGMAKETAHQIGTPLSSLLGWVEILRMDNVAESTVKEIEKDITRLNTIADRFSKIGSIPILKKINLVEDTKQSYEYLKSRSSKQIQFSFNTSHSEIFVDANKQLFAWVIENVIKNAIDAMQGKGKLDVEIKTTPKYANILISDSGKGIPKSQFRKIFETGFTTKKRGWGLGLSLAKRIIEDYHHGKIYVKNSTIGKGTTIMISLKIIN
jgi:signal transduction histidine kinase